MSLIFFQLKKEDAIYEEPEHDHIYEVQYANDDDRVFCGFWWKWS